MKENSDTDGNADETNKNDGPAQNKVVWAIVAAGVVGVLVILLVSLFFPNLTERAKFFTTNTLSVLVLDVIVVQAYIYARQWKAMQDSLKETRNLVAQNERMARAMQRQVRISASQVRQTYKQVDLMRDGLTETRSLVAQTGLAVAAAEQSAQIAREAFHIGQAPYFGITFMTFIQFQAGNRIRLAIAFLNGGKTPAWHFHATPELVFGDSAYPLHDGEHFKCETELAEMGSTFIPSRAETYIEYQCKKFELTTDRLDAINSHKAKLFVTVEVVYMDIWKDWHRKGFRSVWSPDGEDFRDYHAINLA